MNAKTRLIGPAGKLADLFARTLEEETNVKLLFAGAPGVGKSQLAQRTTRKPRAFSEPAGR
jgi:DNA replication protein DnaC